MLTKLRDALCYTTGSSQPEVSAETQREGCIFSSSSKTYVDIFIAFDEAHTLAEATTSGANESFFVILRRTLSLLSRFSLYTFFLSTTGKITQFAQPRERDSSSRINEGTLETPRPFIYLGFDQLMQERKVFDRWNTLDDITSLDCIAHMGRPL